MPWLIAVILLAAACSSKSGEPKPSGPGVALSYELADEKANATMAQQAVEAIRERVKALGIEARVELVGARIRVEIDDASSDDLARARGALDTGGRLEIRKVEANHPVMLAIVRWAHEQEQARRSDVRREIDQWFAGGRSFDDNYLSAPSRAALANLIARFPEIAAIPPNLAMVYEQTTPANPAMKPRWRTYLAGERAGVRGHIRDASVGADPQTGQPVITVRLDDEGTRAFAEFTAAHVGDKLAIIVDDRVLSAPVLQSPIPGGEVWINMGTGDRALRLNEAHSLAAALRTAALPTPLELMSVDELNPR